MLKVSYKNEDEERDYINPCTLWHTPMNSINEWDFFRWTHNYGPWKGTLPISARSSQMSFWAFLKTVIFPAHVNHCTKHQINLLFKILQCTFFINWFCCNWKFVSLLEKRSFEWWAKFKSIWMGSEHLSAKLFRTQYLS